MPKSIEARLIFAVLAYAAAQVGMRLVIGPSLELDEAEAFYQSRELAWGYGPQPPLYFWLQWGLFHILGEGLLALAVLKGLILSGTVLGLFAVLRREAGAAAAAVAALSLSLLPEVLWEGQRALTHSMLALLMAVIVTGLYVRALQGGRWRDHLILGLGLGLGLISKFNFVLWPLGLLAATAFWPDWRRRVRPLNLLSAGAVAALVVAPVGLWMMENPSLATGSVRKLAMDEAGGLMARVEGTRDFLEAVLAFLAVALLVLGGFAWAGVRGAGRLGPVVRLIGAASVLSLAAVWLGLLVSGTTEIAERWLLPLGWGLMPVGVLWLWPGLGHGVRRILAGVVLGLWVLVVPLLPYASLVDPGYRGADFRPLIQDLRERGAGERPLEVDSQWVAGNLALLAPDLSPRFRQPGDPLASGAVLVFEVGSEGAGATDVNASEAHHVEVPRGRRAEQVVVATTGQAQ